MRLVRYNPLNELAFFGNTVNSLFNDSFFNTTESGHHSNWHPAVDILNEDDGVTLHVELPGMEKDDISIQIENKVLTISGERKSETEDKKGSFYRKERRYGNFKRSFSLSDDVLTDEVDAQFKNGVLKISLKKDTTKEDVRQITIN